jgi:hypothetical protein
MSSSYKKKAPFSHENFLIFFRPNLHLSPFHFIRVPLPLCPVPLQKTRVEEENKRREQKRRNACNAHAKESIHPFIDPFPDLNLVSWKEEGLLSR